MRHTSQSLNFIRRTVVHFDTLRLQSGNKGRINISCFLTSVGEILHATPLRCSVIFCFKLAYIVIGKYISRFVNTKGIIHYMFELRQSGYINHYRTSIRTPIGFILQFEVITMAYRIRNGQFMICGMRQLGGGIQTFSKPSNIVGSIHRTIIGNEGNTFQTFANGCVVDIQIRPHIYVNSIFLRIDATQTVGYLQVDIQNAVGSPGSESNRITGKVVRAGYGIYFPLAFIGGVEVGQTQYQRLVGAGSRIHYVHVGQRQHMNHYRVAVAATQGIRSRYDKHGIVVERGSFHIERGARSGIERCPVKGVVLCGSRHGELNLIAIASVKRIGKNKPVLIGSHLVFGNRTLAMGFGISVGTVNGVLRNGHYRTVLCRIVAGIHRITMAVLPYIGGQRSYRTIAGCRNLRQTYIVSNTNRGVIATQGKCKRLINGDFYRIVTHTSALACNLDDYRSVFGGGYRVGIVGNAIAFRTVGPDVSVEAAIVGNHDTCRIVDTHTDGVVAARINQFDGSFTRGDRLYVEVERIGKDTIGNGLHIQFVHTRRGIRGFPPGGIRIHIGVFHSIAGTEYDIDKAPFVICLRRSQRGIVAGKLADKGKRFISTGHYGIASIANDAVNAAFENIERKAVFERAVIVAVHAQVEFYLTGNHIGIRRDVNRMQGIGIDKGTRAGSGPMRRAGSGHGITVNTEGLTRHDSIIRTGFYPGVYGLRSTLDIETVIGVNTAILVLHNHLEHSRIGQRLEEGAGLPVGTVVNAVVQRLRPAALDLRHLIRTLYFERSGIIAAHTARRIDHIGGFELGGNRIENRFHRVAHGFAIGQTFFGGGSHHEVAVGIEGISRNQHGTAHAKVVNHIIAYTIPMVVHISGGLSVKRGVGIQAELNILANAVGSVEAYRQGVFAGYGKSNLRCLNKLRSLAMSGSQGRCIGYGNLNRVNTGHGRLDPQIAVVLYRNIFIGSQSGSNRPFDSVVAGHTAAYQSLQFHLFALTGGLVAGARSGNHHILQAGIFYRYLYLGRSFTTVGAGSRYGKYRGGSQRLGKRTSFGRYGSAQGRTPSVGVRCGSANRLREERRRGVLVDDGIVAGHHAQFIAYRDFDAVGIGYLRSAITACHLP